MSQNAFPDTDVALCDTDGFADVIADFAAAAGRWPHRTAIVHNGHGTTYRDFADRVHLTAAHYRTTRPAAAAPSGLTGLLVSHTPAAAQHLLGILQAGATYCPIDAALPAARRDALAAALGVERLIAAAGIPQAPANTAVPPQSYGDNDAAYVLCTSGSTGAPKPVVVSRRALAATVQALRRLFALTPEDRVLQFASLGWDTCLEEILPALTAGAALVFDDAAHSGSFPSFVRMLAEQEITVLDLPTAFWHELVLFLHEEKAALPASVRLVVIGGERIDPTRLRQWRDLEVGHVGLLNTYGCTETAMVTHAVYLCGADAEPERDVAVDDAEVPMGRALPHVRDHLTDEGELLVAGPSLASGYLGLPEVTAAGFPVADHGFGPTRWFCTGDLVIRGDGGLLYSRGRVDEQVKVSGVRVHPAEVEMQLNTHPAVGGAVVVGERLLGRTSLAAYVVVAGATTPGELKQYLRLRLPSQFVPTKVTFVPALSYTASGKVDRAATRRASGDHNSKGAGQ